MAAITVGALFIGITSTLPSYVEGVLGFGPVVAGFALAALPVGWPLSATLAGRI